LTKKKEFDSIELIDKNASWGTTEFERKYTAIRDHAGIFVTYYHGNYQHLEFKKDDTFEIENDFIVFDENKVNNIPM